MKVLRAIGRYFWNILVSLDQFGNTLLGGNPDETISRRAQRVRTRNLLAEGLCRVLDVLDRDHCARAKE